MSVESNTDSLEGDWRMGPEGIQFLLIHPHYINELGISELIPNMVLPEFEILSEVGNGFTQTVSLMLDSGRTMLSLITESKGERDLNFGFGTLRD